MSIGIVYYPREASGIGRLGEESAAGPSDGRHPTSSRVAPRPPNPNHPPLPLSDLNGDLPHAADLALSGTALLGTLAGQLVFGGLGDRLGRRRVYLITLLLMLTATVGQASAASSVRGEPGGDGGVLVGGVRPRTVWPGPAAPAAAGEGAAEAAPRPTHPSGPSVIGWLIAWRLLLGFAIGGEYPLCASIAAEFSTTANRGAFVAAVFACQGLGILAASLVALAATASMKHRILHDSVLWLDLVWRVELGFGVLPTLGAVWLRSRMPESPHFTADVAGGDGCGTGGGGACGVVGGQYSDGGPRPPPAPPPPPMGLRT